MAASGPQIPVPRSSPSTRRSRQERTRQVDILDDRCPKENRSHVGGQRGSLREGLRPQGEGAVRAQPEGSVLGPGGHREAGAGGCRGAVIRGHPGHFPSCSESGLRWRPTGGF